MLLSSAKCIGSISEDAFGRSFIQIIEGQGWIPGGHHKSLI